MAQIDAAFSAVSPSLNDAEPTSPLSPKSPRDCDYDRDKSPAILEQYLERIERQLSSLQQVQRSAGAAVLGAKLENLCQLLGSLKCLQEHHHSEVVNLLEARSFQTQDADNVDGGQRSSPIGSFNPDGHFKVSPSTSAVPRPSTSSFSLPSLTNPEVIRMSRHNQRLGSNASTQSSSYMVLGMNRQSRSPSIVSGMSTHTGGGRGRLPPLIGKHEAGVAPIPPDRLLNRANSIEEEIPGYSSQQSNHSKEEKPMWGGSGGSASVGLGDRSLCARGFFTSKFTGERYPVAPEDAPSRCASDDSNFDSIAGKGYGYDLADMKKFSMSLGEHNDLQRYLAVSSPGRSASGINHVGIQEIPWFIIQPGSWPRLFWDGIVAFVVLFTGCFIPIGFAYYGRTQMSSGELGAYMVIGDGIWMLDIVINLHTAFAEGGRLVVRRWRIFRRYARKSLLFDLFSIWPIPLAMDNSGLANFFILAKLLRLLRISSLFAKVQCFTSLSMYPAMVAIVIGIICNILTCFWQVIQAGVPTEKLANVGDLYVQDAYWVVMTMSTVGYGDIYPQGTGQRLYTIFMMLIAPLISGAIVSLLSYKIQSTYNDKTAIQVARASRLMKQRKVPLEIQRRVQHNLRTNMQQECHTAAASEILPKLSSTIQRQLLCELMRSTVLQFPLFLGANVAFIGEITQAHTWVECAPGDLVMENGQRVSEIVFIIQGRLLMQHHSPQCFAECRTPEEAMAMATKSSLDALDDEDAADREVGKSFAMQAGAWFGEACLFDDKCVRDCDVIGLMESELAVLNAQDYHHVIKKYPRVLSRHDRIKADLESSKLDIKALKYRPGGADQANVSRRGFAALMAKVLSNDSSSKILPGVH